MGTPPNPRLDKGASTEAIFGGGRLATFAVRTGTCTRPGLFLRQGPENGRLIYKIVGNKGIHHQSFFLNDGAFLLNRSQFIRGFNREVI